MSDWLEQYCAALDVRDAREQAHKTYIDAYTKLADRIAATVSSAPDHNPPTASAAATALPDRTSTPATRRGKETPSSPAPNPSDALPALRTDLATTQKARAQLQSRVDELSGMLASVQKAEQRANTETAALRRQKGDLERKLRDREEEIRGKASLVEGAQDEMVALEMQLNVAEQRSRALERENKELVDRWIRYKEEEAERVNRASRWE